MTHTQYRDLELVDLATLAGVTGAKGGPAAGKNYKRWSDHSPDRPTSEQQTQNRQCAEKIGAGAAFGAFGGPEAAILGAGAGAVDCLISRYG